MKRTLIRELKPEEYSKISGWALKIRDTKYMVFIVLQDRSGKIQVSIDKKNNEELVKKLEGVLASSILSFTGKMVLSEYVKDGGKEFLPEGLEILSRSDALPLDETASIDTRLDYRWIDLRSEKNNLMLKVQAKFVEGMREFLLNNDFTEIHTPKLIGAASESGSEVFEVKYFDRKAILKVKNTTQDSVEFIYELSSKTYNLVNKKEKNITDLLYELGAVEYVNIVTQSDEISG